MIYAWPHSGYGTSVARDARGNWLACGSVSVGITLAGQGSARGYRGIDLLARRPIARTNSETDSR